MSNAHVRELRVDTLIARSLYELKLSMYIHCRRMQYDLVVLLHFSATHGPLFVIVFSKEQKKITEYCTGFFPSISIQIQVRIQSDSILVIFPFTQGRQIYFYVQMYTYNTHTHLVCVYLYTRKFIAFGRRQKMSVGVVCMHNERAKQYTLLHRI